MPRRQLQNKYICFGCDFEASDAQKRTDHC